MVPDPLEEAKQRTGRVGENDVMIDTSETSRASQKVDLDLDDAPFLEEAEEDAPEPQSPRETIRFSPDDAEAPPPKDKKKLLVIGAIALVLVLALGLAAKLFLFKGKSAATQENAPVASVADNATKPPAPELPEIQVRLEPFWVEQKGENDEVRFLIARILLGTHKASVAADFESRKMQARNAIVYYLKNKDVQFLTDETNAEKLKSELLLVVNQYVSDDKFETLLFEEYVVK